MSQIIENLRYRHVSVIDSIIDFTVKSAFELALNSCYVVHFILFVGMSLVN